MAERLDDIYALLVTIQLNMQENFTFLNKKIDEVEERLNKKIDAVEARLNARIDAVEIKIQEVETRLDEKIDNLEIKLTNKIESVRKELKQDIRNTKNTLRKEISKTRTDLVDFIEECDDVINQRTIDNKKRIIKIESYFPQEATLIKENKPENYKV